MNWLSKLFGGGDKPIDVGPAPEGSKEGDVYTVAWRNRYMAARIQHLEKKVKKKNIGGVIAYNLPQDVQSGSLEDLETLNQQLEKRIKYLEGLLVRS